MSATKKLFVKTYGCQMNVYDSQRMQDVLAPLGYQPVDEADGADMVILNTCHIREKAAEKVFSDLGRIRKHKKAKEENGTDKMIVAVAGCVAQAEGAELMRREPIVDMVFGPQTYHRLPEMVARANRAIGNDRIIDTDFPVEEKFDHLPAQVSQQGYSAFIAIQEGCDKFCTFCVVPYTRGAEYSRPGMDIVNETRQIVAQGTREVTLLGQNVNAYHGAGPDGDEWTLGRLLRELSDIEGLERIRYITSHPRDVDDDLIFAHRDLPKVMPFLHLPVQSGSDRVLQAMNRKHDRQTYFDIVKRLRDAQPDLALSSDFIVGFPGESEKDFEDTLDLVRQVGFIQTFSFKYSPRPGTPASAMELQVPEEVKADRLARLQALLAEQQLAFNESCVGKEMDVLLDRTGKFEGQIVGRSPYMQPVHVNGLTEADLGRIVRLKITAAKPFSLAGELVEDGGSERNVA
ncbi:tRNA (N6-isopentenyl adenosine(37)-C2)-methylthiotransferase MiaB [Thalassospira marina]|uniref:tRNA-2-methylthio-N(6)-dimethylallyladenosine synthase n=1 Tax=Thalassospira marina TaxID=2048283 RepID=A0A2N3KW28_9PROT|nr:tRNA (N6-isopentenyl adenosine(37)-C2)-methylthiotransferase MiaB [Thalassospira marina]AUG54734.1 tRNA (N6-isopentenyl adenosine(37)-C2)-methylthiotransferase MiaB [Thalassospira marina]PKR54738.1 tRNA (N6-isopentenyl adenosine(37)-C2)-methylthiotransferase MiaB [Thalassospira marina]